VVELVDWWFGVVSYNDNQAAEVCDGGYTQIVYRKGEADDKV
jgi:hypothetical protein